MAVNGLKAAPQKTVCRIHLTSYIQSEEVEGKYHVSVPKSNSVTIVTVFVLAYRNVKLAYYECFRTTIRVFRRKIEYFIKIN